MLVALTGTGFALPPPPATRGVTPKPKPSLSVTFTTVKPATANTPQITRVRAAAEVSVVSSTLAYALVPAMDAGLATVTLQNLDAAGAPVSGETVAKTHAFTFVMPDLAAATDLQRIIQALLRALKREVLENVAQVTHTEYDDSPGDTLNVLADAKLPVIILVGPAMPENRFYARNKPREVANQDGTISRLRPSKTVDLVFTLVGATDSTIELLNLNAALGAFFERNPYLEVDRDGADPAKGTVLFEMQASFDGLNVETRPNESNVRQFQGEFRIRGVELDDPNMVVGVSLPVLDYVPLGTPSYTPEEAATVAAWPVILGSNASAVVTPTSTPNDLEFEQLLPGDHAQ